MATIPMTSGFTRVPEGTHVFRIYNVEYDPTFGKIVVHLVTAQGITHREYFGLIGKDGNANEGACNKFSFFAKTALNNFSLSEIDHTDLVNHYIKAKVEHTVVDSTTEPGKTKTFVNLNNYEVASEFDETPVEKALTLGASFPNTMSQPRLTNKDTTNEASANTAPPLAKINAPITASTALSLTSLLG